MDFKKKEPTVHCLQETCIRSKDTHRLRVEGLEKNIFMQMQIIKTLKRGNECHYILIKGPIKQEDI